MFCFVSGERRTVVSCMKIINKTMTQVNNSYCQVENRPSPQIRPCNLHPCQYRYQLHHIFSKLSVLPDICVSCAFFVPSANTKLNWGSNLACTSCGEPVFWNRFNKQILVENVPNKSTFSDRTEDIQT